GLLSGFGFLRSIFVIGIPIMGGGMGAGAIPLSQIMAGPLDLEPEAALSQMVPAVALANALAIVTASILHRLGPRYPALCGEGRLMKAETALPLAGCDSDESTVNLASLGMELIMSAGFLALGEVVERFISLHPYAIMIIVVA